MSIENNKLMNLADGKVLYDDLRGRVGDLKSAVDDLEDEVDLKVNRPTTSPSGTSGMFLKTNGDGSTTWDYPFTEPVGEAVQDWLDDHPEATTTVQDGSLTEAKFTDATKLKVLNDYVTPEMFGAKGDGETDDTQAIKDMFASDYNKFSFANKTYITDGAIDVTKSCEIRFDHTTLKAKKSYHVRNFEYMLGIKAYGVKTVGKLTMRGNTSVNVCLWLAQAGGADFDRFEITNARIWGVYVDKTTDGNNSLHFNALAVSQCGFKAHAKAKYVNSTTLEITNITGGFTGYNDDMRPSVFANNYHQANLVIDDSLYTADRLRNRLVFYHSGDTDGFTLDENDLSKATFNVNTNGPGVPSDYHDGGEARKVFIPIGGGVHFVSNHSEGVFRIEALSTQSNPMGLYLNHQYGGSIGSYATEYDTIVLHNECFYVDIGYMYSEAVGNGYESLFNNGYDRIFHFSQTVDMARTIVHSPFVGQNRFPFATGNCVVNYRQTNTEPEVIDALSAPDFLSFRKLSGVNYDGIGYLNEVKIDEYFPRNITADVTGAVEGQPITLNLRDPRAGRKGGGFEPVTFFIKRRNTNSDNNTLKIRLASALLTEGYTLHGAVNDVIILNPSDYGNLVKVTIVLFNYTKEFYVFAETIGAPTVNGVAMDRNRSLADLGLVTSLSNASTDTQYPSAKCVYDIIGDVETLLAGI